METDTAARELNFAERIIDMSAELAAPVRVAYAPKLFWDLVTTPPQERTRRKAVEVGVVAGSDVWDGLVKRLLHTESKAGGRRDELADKILSGAGILALAYTGEIPASYAYLNVGRDLFMTVGRSWVSRHDQDADVSAGSLGKATTLIKNNLWVTASSSKAMNRDGLRRRAAMATAMSLTSGADYAIDYFENREKPPATEETTTRNSLLRKVFAGRIDKLVSTIDEKWPDVQPDHLTDLGKWLVIGGYALALAFPDHSTLPVVLTSAGGVFDGLDGSLDQTKRARTGAAPSDEGMLKDVETDKIVEIISFGALSLIARLWRGNQVAADNYAVATMTAVLPALIRAQAETRGLVVAEGGIGTRVGRAILGGVGLGFNKRQGASDIVSATVLANNLITAKERWAVIKDGDQAPHYKGKTDDPEFMRKARVRRKALLKLAAVGAVAGTGLLLIKPKQAQQA